MRQDLIDAQAHVGEMQAELTKTQHQAHRWQDQVKVCETEIARLQARGTGAGSPPPPKPPPRQTHFYITEVKTHILFCIFIIISQSQSSLHNKQINGEVSFMINTGIYIGLELSQIYYLFISFFGSD